MDRATIHAFIRQQNTEWCRVLQPMGRPSRHSSGSPQLRAWKSSSTVKNSRKYPNLIQRPACSLVVGWSGEQTIQLEGLAEYLQGAVLKEFQDVYFAEWPECREHMSWPGIAYFVVRPHWIRYSDYDQKPPLIQEFAKEDLADES